MIKKKVFFISGIIVLLALLFLIPVIVPSVYWIHVFIIILATSLATASLRAITRTGEMSLGTAGFMLLGAYGSALLAVKLGLSFWVALPLGGLIAAGAAFLVGYPFFRVKGVYFAILTLLLATVFLYVAGYWSSLTGGWNGLRNIPAPTPITLFGNTISFEADVPYYYLALVIVIICLFILYRMEHARIGLVWGAIREADNLANSVGINVTWQKIFIFGVACFFIGIAGGLSAFYIRVISPATNPGGMFSMFASIYAIMYMVVGGEGSFWGPLIGTPLLLIIPELARPLAQYRPLLNGAVLILIIFFMPTGLVGLGHYFGVWSRKLAGCFKKIPFRQINHKTGQEPNKQEKDII